MSERSYHGAISRSYESTMKDRSDHPSEVTSIFYYEVSTNGKCVPAEIYKM